MLKTTLTSIAFALLAAFNCSLAAITVTQSTPSLCAWTYDPGQPVDIWPDSTNPAGGLAVWSDAAYGFAGGAIVPYRVFYVAIPSGTRPRLEIASIKSTALGIGLCAQPPADQDESLRASANAWAVLSSVSEWRQFQLARVHVYLQRGNFQHSEGLESIALRLIFDGDAEPPASKAKDGELLESIAINGDIASHWWTAAVSETEMANPEAWPDYPLQRLAVTETGLYQVTGTSLAGSALVGSPITQIKVFGNGGAILPLAPETPTDDELEQDAAHIEDLNDNGQFDENDRILFFGKGLKGAEYCDGTYLNNVAHHSSFSTENAYFVGADPVGAPGLRMASVPTTGNGASITRTTAREYIDQDAFIYSRTLWSESGLVWYMSTLNPGQERSYILNLERAVSSQGLLRIDLESHYPESTTSGFYIFVNENQITGSWFSNLPVSFAIPAGVLVPGNNIIRVGNNSGITAYVNYADIEFQREIASPSGYVEFRAPADQTGVFRYVVSDLGSDAYILDITNPLTPRLARGNAIVDSSDTETPRRYAALRPDRIREPVYRGVETATELDYARLRNPENGAGLIIITYDDWYDALDSLKVFHESYREEPLSTIRVKLGDIYDEFAWGVRDVVAIRNFLKYAYNNWHGQDGQDTVKYVLFVGDGDYDYRNIISASDANWMPPWEWGGDCTDDFYSKFASGGGVLPSLLTGRLPVQSLAEVQAAVSKIISYATRPLYGPWKNTATFAADDEVKQRCYTGGSETYHTAQSENLINNVLPEYFTFKKVFEIFYPVHETPAGATKPDATRDLLESINRGTLIVNYAGHGNERIWTDEQLFVADRDYKLLNNERTWPLYVAATCSWGFYDRPTGRCFPEMLVTSADEGAIASLAATRFTYSLPNDVLAQAFYNRLFRFGLTERQSFGAGLLAGKATGASASDLYHIFGDPVLRLATPEYHARITSSDDSLRALSLFHLQGEVSQTSDGPVWSDFQGAVEVRVFDTEDSTAYYWCNDPTATPIYIGLPGNAIFRGTASIHNGEFDVTFRIPRDIRFGGNNAKISLYFFGKGDADADSADGIGIREHIPIANQPSAETDSIPPQISLWLEVPSFRSGDVVSPTPRLHVTINDTSGINLSGEVGHRITARIGDAQAEDLTPFFNYDLDSYTSGSLDKVIGPLSEGEHRLTIEAWDSFNNLNQLSMVFTVGKSGEEGYALRDVYNWPNPMSGVTYFTYYLTQSDTRLVTLRVFTLTGKLIFETKNLSTIGPGYNSNSDYPWDGRDREGHLLANGTYLYKLVADHANGHSAEATGKLVILR